MMKKNYHRLLLVEYHATIEDIKESHRKLVKQYHPDRNLGSIESSEITIELNNARDILVKNKLVKNLTKLINAKSENRIEICKAILDIAKMYKDCDDKFSKKTYEECCDRYNKLRLKQLPKKTERQDRNKTEIAFQVAQRNAHVLLSETLSNDNAKETAKNELLIFLNDLIYTMYSIEPADPSELKEDLNQKFIEKILTDDRLKKRISTILIQENISYGKFKSYFSKVFENFTNDNHRMYITKKRGGKLIKSPIEEGHAKVESNEDLIILKMTIEDIMKELEPCCKDVILKILERKTDEETERELRITRYKVIKCKTELRDRLRKKGYKISEEDEFEHV